MAILLVERLAKQALEIAGHVTLGGDGCVTATSAPNEFYASPEPQEVYLGGPNALQ